MAGSDLFGKRVLPSDEVDGGRCQQEERQPPRGEPRRDLVEDVANGDDLPAISIKDETANVLDVLGEGVEEHDLLRPERDNADRIDDRSEVEEQARKDLPELPCIAEAHIQRREDEREGDDKQVELEEQRNDQQPLERRCDAV